MTGNQPDTQAGTEMIIWLPIWKQELPTNLLITSCFPFCTVYVTGHIGLSVLLLSCGLSGKRITRRYICIKIRLEECFVLRWVHSGIGARHSMARIMKNLRILRFAVHDAHYMTYSTIWHKNGFTDLKNACIASMKNCPKPCNLLKVNPT